MSFHLHLDTERVRHIRADEPVCVAPDVPLRDVLRDLRQAKRDSVLICQSGKLVGIFTERDALKLFAAKAAGEEVDLGVAIGSVMTHDPAYIGMDETVGAAIHKMSAGLLRRLPVLDDQHCPVGMLKVSHILHYLVEHFPHVIYTLPPSPHHVTQQREGA